MEVFQYTNQYSTRAYYILLDITSGLLVLPPTASIQLVVLARASDPIRRLWQFFIILSIAKFPYMLLVYLLMMAFK